MKKRILVFSMVLALTTVMALPMAASAEGGSTVVQGAVAEIATVTGLSITSGNPDTTTASLTITGTNFDSTADPVPSVVFSGTGITTGTVVVSTSTSITTTFIIAAGAAAGDQTVTVNQGGQVGTVGFAFTVSTQTTVSAPSGFTLPAMTLGTTKTGSSSNGLVTTNTSTWVVTVKDANQDTNTGHMLNGSSQALVAPLMISKTSTTEGLTNSSSGITYSAAALDPTTLDLYVSQAIATNEQPGVYSITIAFTVSTP